MSDVQEIQPDIEARVLGQVLCSAVALDDAADLEVYDFHIPVYRLAMAAIREIQERGETVGVLHVLDEMELALAERDGVVNGADIAAGVTQAILAPTYGMRRESFLADMKFLHDIAVSRREAGRAA